MTMTFLKRKVTPIELGLDNGSKCKHKEAYLYKKQDHLQPLPFFVSSPQDSLFADRVHESQGVLQLGFQARKGATLEEKAHRYGEQVTKRVTRKTWIALFQPTALHTLGKEMYSLNTRRSMKKIIVISHHVVFSWFQDMPSRDVFMNAT